MGAARARRYGSYGLHDVHRKHPAVLLVARQHVDRVCRHAARARRRLDGRPRRRPAHDASPPATGRPIWGRSRPMAVTLLWRSSRRLAPRKSPSCSLAGGDPTRLTEINHAVNALEMPTFKAITWKSADGLEVEGFLWTPANATARTAPAVAPVDSRWSCGRLSYRVQRTQQRPAGAGVGNSRTERPRQHVVRRCAS